MLVILGNQLFPPAHLPPPDEGPVFMAEDVGLCTYVKHHQQKIVLFLAAMRSYADALRSAGYDVIYHELDVANPESYEDKLDAALRAKGATRLQHFEIEDKPMERRLVEFAEHHELARLELQSPMFMSTRDAFSSFARDKSRLLMGDFYKQQRRSLGVLIDDDGQPTGGRWSFDADNRKKLPRNVTPPELTWATPTQHVGDVIELVLREFADHPGDATRVLLADDA